MVKSGRCKVANLLRNAYGSPLPLRNESGPPRRAAHSFDQALRLPDALVGAVGQDLVDTEAGSAAHVAGALERAPVVREELDREPEQALSRGQRDGLDLAPNLSAGDVVAVRSAHRVDRRRVDQDGRVAREAEGLRVAAVMGGERLHDRV